MTSISPPKPKKERTRKELFFYDQSPASQFASAAQTHSANCKISSVNTFDIQHISRSRFLSAEHHFTVIIVCESKRGRYGFGKSSRGILRVHSVAIGIPANRPAAALSAGEGRLPGSPQPEAVRVGQQPVR